MNDIIAEIILYRIPNTVNRKGYIVFTTGHGYRFYCSGEKVSDRGNLHFGGYVGKVVPNKDTRSDGVYYIKFIEASGDKEHVLNVILTKVTHSNGQTYFDEDPTATGIMYVSGEGICTGVLFKPDEPEVPAPVETVPQVQNRKKPKGNKTAEPMGDNVVPIGRTGKKKDDIPF